MQPLEALLDDPILQLLLFVILVIGVVDAFKFALSWIWRKLDE